MQQNAALNQKIGIKTSNIQNNKNVAFKKNYNSNTSSYLSKNKTAGLTKSLRII